ncbi:disulfide bond formation protein DsbA [Candidatus Uhrbacteria bacterium CG10_big_fil_rev_8_21_14_0_10_48_11]|uniref:Disulfide bond formation protein DsbA n=1 Tax=Candidatus Uhrbacteria bacterium CG10_big_fil_rev_8_21_14_0_10_48_11 TaxID=1975037 RepID=A0A2M8LEW9_9BACT|nr:MAG: disulfide bond formation protein DsbA [Candidatus Uhrbacteria bacterium CG10_big_fil_rev_8_21_14_0_10_48_11]
MDDISFTKRERREERKAVQVADRKSAAYQEKVQRVGLWAVVVVLVVGGVWYLSRGGGSSGQPGPVVPTVNQVTADDWTAGSADAPLMLVEYSDFQCPACGNYYTTVKKVTQDFSNQVHFVYRNFPLRTLHPNAEPAAWAAEAAGRQGKFWEMHDLLFERQSQWADNLNTKSTFHGYAVELGLDGNQFDSDYSSSAVRNKVATDVASGTVAKVPGTPTFFLNGQKVSPSPDYASFSTLINDALAAQK